MSEEFYLPEDTVEWIAQKKSELLAWVLQHQAEGDIPFEEHEDFSDRIPETLSSPDEDWSQKWEGQSVRVQIKMFEDDAAVGTGVYWMFIVSLMSPVINSPGAGEVLVPILAIPTWETKWLRTWLRGNQVAGKQVH